LQGHGDLLPLKTSAAIEPNAGNAPEPASRTSIDRALHKALQWTSALTFKGHALVNHHWVFPFQGDDRICNADATHDATHDAKPRSDGIIRRMKHGPQAHSFVPLAIQPRQISLKSGGVDYYIIEI